MPSDPKLTSVLREAQKKPVFFAFVAKGMEGALLAQKKKISRKESVAAKKELGGGTIFQGRCKGENGTLVFEVAKEPPTTLANLIKKIIKQDAGLTYPVEVRVAADLEEEEEEEEDEQTESETADDDKPSVGPQAVASPGQSAAAAIKRLNAMSADIKTALAGPHKARIQALFVAVNGHIKNNNQVQADQVLDELAPLVAKSTVPPPPQQSAGQPDAARFAARLKALAPVMQKAATTGTDAANAARAQFADANKLYLAKQYGEANAALNRAETLLKQAFTAAPRGAGSTAKAPQQPSNEPDLGPWQGVRQNTVTKLRALASKLAASKHSRAQEAEIEIRSVIQQLTAKPATLQQIAELERYLKQDPVVGDVCKLAFDFRTPLLKALAELKPQLAA